MNCIIISDKITGKLLEEFVVRTSTLTLIAVFNDSEQARELISKRQDLGLVFLDLENLGMDAFDFISGLAFQPNIIMVSSGDQDALKAFDFNVVDYLLKPVTYPRFYKAIDKAVRYYSRKEAGSSGDNEIFIKRGSALIRIKLKDIIFIEALENYVTLNTRSERYTILFTMKGIENQLPSGVFIRVHRSFIVNKSMVQTISENAIDVLVGDTVKSLPLGKSFREKLLNEINLMTRQ